MKREYLIAIQGALATVGAFLSDKLGVLYPLMCLLFAEMAVDYFTGMLASKREAIDHPNDPNYGWSSKKGAIGIIKKAGYVFVIMAAMILDYIIAVTAGKLGFDMPTTAVFGLLVVIWYLLNEMLSIIENAGRMGADIPSWLCNYIAVLKNKIDAENSDERR